MRYISTLIAVRDMERAKKFYCNVLGLSVLSDFGANLTLTGGISLQTIETWTALIHMPSRDVILKNYGGELYFEEDEIEAFSQRLLQFPDIKYVHPLFEHRWGQRVVRIFDPDGHMIEVGESLSVVVRRFLQSGLSIQETAARMEIPEETVRAYTLMTPVG